MLAWRSRLIGVVWIELTTNPQSQSRKVQWLIVSREEQCRPTMLEEIDFELHLDLIFFDRELFRLFLLPIYKRFSNHSRYRQVVGKDGLIFE